MMAFRVQIVLHVPPLLASVKPAHKMELHVIAVKVDFMLTQTLVNEYRQFYMNKKHNFSKIGWEITKNYI